MSIDILLRGRETIAERFVVATNFEERAYGFYHNDFAIHSSNSSFEAILKSIKTFDKVEERTGYFDVGFVNKCKDTIYSSSDFKEWIVKEKGKSTYYSYPKIPNKNTDTLFIKSLKQTNSFYRNWDCKEE